MPSSDLLDFMKLGVETVRRGLDGPEDDWSPMMAARSKDDEFHIIAIPPAGASELERAMLWGSTVPNLLIEVKAVEVCIVMSAWLRKAEAGTDPDDIPPEERPLNRPDDRIDALVLTHVTADREQMEVAEVTRNPSGPPTLSWREDIGQEISGLGGRVVAAVRRGLLS